ncbi:MAG: CD1845 family protein [Clostridiales bacterium]|nr:CD1845 family protein [Clostridiales bacterium]
MLLKLPLKLIAFPAALVVTLAQWAGVFLTSFAGAILYILSGLCFLIAVLGYLMGIHTGSEAACMFGVGFVAFGLPLVAGWLIGKASVLNAALWDFIKS